MSGQEYQRDPYAADSVRDEILKFIDEFVRRGGNPVKRTFTHGLCYWFAIILTQRFQADEYPHVAGTIMYNPVDNHFAVEFMGMLFDITGIIPEEDGYVNWEEYKKSETHPRTGPSSHLSGLLANCVLLDVGDSHA